jgi:hypothetical protein
VKYILTVSALVLLAGCGTSTSTVQETTVEDIPDPYGDPPGYTGDPFAGFGPITSLSLPASEGEEVAEVAVEESAEASGPWSVQIAACGTMESALTLRDTVSNQIDEPVFIDHIGSYYKVRVGSFANSSDSDALRTQLRCGGYPDAWSVQR